jgi:HSP20 family protein
MNIAKFNHAHPSESISKWIDTLFNTSLADVIGTDSMLSSPSVNITENESQFVLHLAAPGLTKQDFNISIENDHLVISAEKKSEKEESKEGKFTRREFNYASFKRTFPLDDMINREGITAAYEDGVLKMTLPKKEESARKQISQTIEIK